MADFVKQIAEIWNEKGAQAAHDRAEECLETISKETGNLQRQKRAITILLQHLETAGAEASAPAEPPETVRPADRPAEILNAAEAVMEAAPGNPVVHVQEVLAELRRRDADLGVQQPLAVIGTVLSGSDRYQKVARNKFRQVDPQPPQM